jgi:hypothetical protein
LDVDVGGTHVEPEGDGILKVRENAVGGGVGDVAPKFVEGGVRELDSEAEWTVSEAVDLPRRTEAHDEKTERE